MDKRHDRIQNGRITKKKAGNDRIKERLRWLLIVDQRLECGRCASVYQEHGKKPLCKTEKGCPIEDLATDYQVNKTCRDFINAKKIEAFKGYEHAKVKALEESGITDLDLIFDLEQVWLNYQAVEAEKRKQHGNK